MTSLVTKAIRNFINVKKKNNKKQYVILKRCKNTVKKNYFGEGVKLQRKLRDEWDN